MAITNTVGDGSELVVEDAVPGYRDFSVFQDPLIDPTWNSEVEYCVLAGDQFEVGRGIYNSGTIQRSQIVASTNSGAKVNLPAGPKQVFAHIASQTLTKFAALAEDYYTDGPDGNSVFVLGRSYAPNYNLYNSGFGIGRGVLPNLTSGNRNFAIGNNSGRGVTTGSGNLYIGDNASNATSLGSPTNAFDRCIIDHGGPTTGTGQNARRLIDGVFPGTPFPPRWAPGINEAIDLGAPSLQWKDLYVAENVYVADGGHIFIGEDEVLPGGGGGGGGTPTLTADLSIYVSPSGDDANDGLSSGAPVETIAKALELAGGYYIPSPWFLKIRLMAGLHDADATITPVHPQSERLIIEGEKFETTIFSATRTSGSPGDQTISINTDDPHNLASNNYALITNTSGGTNPHHIAGVWRVVSTPTATNANIKTTILGSQVPSAATGDLTSLKTRVSGNWVIPLAGDRVTLKDFVSVGSGSGTGIEVNAGTRLLCEGVGVHGWLVNMNTQSGSVIDLQACALCGAKNTALVMLGTDLFCPGAIFSGNVDYGIEPSTSRMTGHGAIFVGNRRSMFFRGGSCDATAMQVLSHAENAINGSSTANMDVRNSTIRDCGGNGVVSTYYAFIDARSITFSGISGSNTSAANGGNIRT